MWKLIPVAVPMAHGPVAVPVAALSPSSPRAVLDGAAQGSYQAGQIQVHALCWCVYDGERLQTDASSMWSGVTPKCEKIQKSDGRPK
jgi:hypothetical protein